MGFPNFPADSFLTGRVARFLFRRPRGRRGQSGATFWREPSGAVGGIGGGRGRAGQGGGRRCRRSSGTARTFVGLPRLVRGRRGHGGAVVAHRQPRGRGDKRIGSGFQVGDRDLLMVVETLRVAATSSVPSHRKTIVTVFAADIGSRPILVLPLETGGRILLSGGGTHPHGVQWRVERPGILGLRRC